MEVFDKLQTVLGAMMKFMYKVLGIFGIVAEDDDTGIKLSDAFQAFADDLSKA